MGHNVTGTLPVITSDPREVNNADWTVCREKRVSDTLRGVSTMYRKAVSQVCDSEIGEK